MKRCAFLRKFICFLLAAAVCIYAGVHDAAADAEISYTVKCQTADGSELASYTQAAGAGTDVTVKSPDIQGFQAVSRSYTFTLSKAGQVLVITYRRAGGTDIGSAYGTTYNGTEIETIPEEQVPLSSGQVKGYTLLAVDNNAVVALFSSMDAAAAKIVLVVFSAAAVILLVLLFSHYKKNKNALQHVFADCLRDSNL